MVPLAVCASADAELQAAVGPDFLLQAEKLAELFLRRAQPGFDAAHRFVAAEPMRDGDDERLGHWPYMGTVFRRSKRQTTSSLPSGGKA
jgi:hypothetical protein